LVLIEEACRLVDRLDRLDAIVNGAERSWLKLEYADDGVEVTVVVDKVLTEARQQQIALKQIVAELRQAARQAVEDANRAAKGKPTAPEVGPGVADLTKRIADRRRQASS
jgi:ribosome recycling factor